MKSLVITGTAGFIGFNYLKYFIDNERFKNYRNVVCIDKMGYATIYNREEYDQIFLENPNMVGICANILNLNSFAFEKWLDDGEKIDILDFAAESHVDNSIENPQSIFTENSLIPLMLLKSLEKQYIDTYWHISTDEVYGDLPLNASMEDWFTPESQYDPHNPYSASKVAQDAYLNSLKHTFGLNVKFIRMANQFGPHQHPEKMIPASILRSLRGESIKVYGDGKNIRQWTNVEDTVKIIDDLVLYGTNDYVTHLADPKNLFDNNFIVNIIKDLLVSKGIDVKIEYIKDRLGHDRAYALKVDSTIENYYNKSFDQTLNRTIDFYIERFNDGKYN